MAPGVRMPSSCWGRQMTVARCTVELVMRRLSLAGLPGRPRYRKIPNTPTASDLVNRDFARTEPNWLWLTDITEHRTREGKVYCAVVLDAFSRRALSSGMRGVNRTSLVQSMAPLGAHLISIGWAAVSENWHRSGTSWCAP